MKIKIPILASHFLLSAFVTAQEPRLTVAEAEQEFPMAVPLAVEIERPTPSGYAPLLKTVTPSVVSIFSAINIDTENATPLDRFFGQGEGAGAEPGERPMGSGSGVILSSKGWIVTNSHVVHLPNGQLADAIKVQLHDSRLFPATIVGVDPKTDLALLKIEAPDLQAIVIGDSGKALVGDLVFAIGNPFRVGMTATMGMVSAVRRTGLGINGPGGYESFIQMDAAINPGNSGGALINVEGQLIGINTAIYGGQGGNVGIGFAIPTDLMRPVVMFLAEEGEVSRGFFGVKTCEMGERDLIEGAGKGFHGAVVEELMEDGPAAKAGLREGDVVLVCNGIEIMTVGDFRLGLSLIQPDGLANLEVRRGGQVELISMRAIEDASEVGEGRAFAIPGFEGLTFVIEDELVVIHETEASFKRLGFEKGMALVSINGTKITDPSAAEAVLRKGVNKIVTTLAGQTHTLALRIEQ